MPMDERCPEARSLFTTLEHAIQALADLERQRKSTLHPSTESDAATLRRVTDARNRFTNAQLAMQEHKIHCQRCQAALNAVE